MANVLLITPDSSFEDYATKVLSTVHHVLRAGGGEAAVCAFLTCPVAVVVADSLVPDLTVVRERLEVIDRSAGFVFVSPPTSEWAAPGLPLRDGDRLVWKPALSGELRAAVAKLLHEAQIRESVLDLVGVTFDRANQSLSRADEIEQLTPTEFLLLDDLASVRGTTVSCAELLDHVWHYTSGVANSDVVRSHLKNLRGKIRRINGGNDLIETIPRRGYRLIPD